VVGGERGGAIGMGFGVTVAESDLPIFKSDDVSIADGHAEDVGGEVLQSGLTATDWDDIHDPVLAPELCWNLIEEAGLFEEVTELGPEDFGQGPFGEEVFSPCGDPSEGIWAESAARDEIVHMGVVAKVAGPGLQDSEDSEGASDVFGIGSEFLQGLLGSLVEQVVEGFLIAADLATQARRQGEGGHEVGDGQKEFSLLTDPAVDQVVLALGTVAVFAGVILVVFLVALRAEVEVAAEGLGATSADVLYSPPVAGQEPVLVFGYVVRSVQAEDVRQLRHL